jgi:hypothetical protein
LCVEKRSCSDATHNELRYNTTNHHHYSERNRDDKGNVFFRTMPILQCLQ